MRLKFLFGLPLAMTLLLLGSNFTSTVSSQEGSSSLEFVGQVLDLAVDVVVNGDLAYVAGRHDGLKIVDVFEPSNPQEVGAYNRAGDVFYAVDIFENHAYIIDRRFRINRLNVIDVSNPSVPFDTAIEGIPGVGAGVGIRVEVSGNYAYIANAHGGLVVFDISSPASPVSFPPYDPPGTEFRGLEVVGNLVYIAAGGGRFLIVDVSNPSNIFEIANISVSPGNPLGVAVSGNYAYVAGGNRGLRIVDVSDPGNPVNVGFYDDPEFGIVDVEVSGNYAFVAAGPDGVSVIDVSDPSSPSKVATYNTPGYAQRLAIAGDLIFVADSEGGLVILRFEEITPEPTPEPTPTPFLDLPWDYTGKSFNEAALAINSFFDHEYPLLSTNLVEPANSRNQVTIFEGEKSTTKHYSTHDGFDWGRDSGADLGRPVLAAAEGCAAYHSSSAGGNIIKIDHANGYQTRYLHLQSEGLVTSNTNSQSCVQVTRGQQIGLVGFSGKVRPKGEAGAHIHFMVIEDKNGDGNFDDNIPDGLTDPFGWTGDNPDPWSNFNFFYNGEDRGGNTSHYLWTKSIFGFSGLIPSSGVVFDVGRYSFDFPDRVTSEDLTVEVNAAPVARPSDNLRSIGSTVEVNAKNGAGEAVTNLLGNFTLSVDFSPFDLISYKQETMAIYTTEDGVNWVEVETDIDFNNKTATAELNHLSQFALMAERTDTTPPETAVDFSGLEGLPGWFRSDVQVELNAQDSGLGVDYSLYKLNDEDWQEYTAPPTFSEEGHYLIEFYSVDNDENIEEVQNVEFNIDKAHPEAKVQFNPETSETEITGLDENGNPEVSVEDINRWRKRIVVSDKAGNTLTIVARNRNRGRNFFMSFKSIAYNSNTPVQLDANIFRTRYSRHSLSQNWYDSGVVFLRIYYNARRDRSRILKKEIGGDLFRETQNGLILLYVQTNNGNLEFGY